MSRLQTEKIQGADDRLGIGINTIPDIFSTPSLMQYECEVAERRPEITLSHSRKYCVVCGIRKTYFVIAFSMWAKARYCFVCMPEEIRNQFRREY